MGALLSNELRGWKPGAIKNFLVTGGSTSTNLTCTGIAIGDEIRRARYFPASGLPTDVLSEITITLADKVQLASTTTTSGRIDVEWISAAAL